MTNTKIKSALLLSLTLFFSCDDQLIENSNEDTSSTTTFSSSSSPFIGGTKSSQILSSSSQTSIDTSLIQTTLMNKFNFSGGPLKILNGDLYHFGNGVQKADLKNKKWITLGSNDEEFTQNLFYFDNQILRLILNNSKVQSYSTSWNSYKALDVYSPLQIEVLNSDTLLWLDNTAFSKIYTKKLGFEAKWTGLEVYLASDLKINQSEIALCKGSFYWLNRSKGQFQTSSNPCEKISFIQKGWLVFDTQNSGSIDAYYYEKGALLKSLVLPHDEIPLSFDINGQSYLYFKNKSKLYSFDQGKLSISKDLAIPQNTDQILFDNEILWGLDSLGNLTQIKY